jgi:hypothetical protein
MRSGWMRLQHWRHFRGGLFGWEADTLWQTCFLRKGCIVTPSILPRRRDRARLRGSRKNKCSRVLRKRAEKRHAMSFIWDQSTVTRLLRTRELPPTFRTPIGVKKRGAPWDASFLSCFSLGGFS